MIYLDNGATTKLEEAAFEAMKPYLLEEYGNAMGNHPMAAKSRRAVELAREQVADLLGARPSEIYFTSGGTESNNWAIKMTAAGGDLSSSHIITSVIEHPSVRNTCRYLGKLGCQVSELPVDEQGILDLQALERAAESVAEARQSAKVAAEEGQRDAKVAAPEKQHAADGDPQKASNRSIRLLSIMTANNEIGTIQPIADIEAIAREYGFLFHTDAVQAAGHILVDVREHPGIHMLSASGHKFGGPKGIGFLYIRDGIFGRLEEAPERMQPFFHGGGQEKEMRAGTHNVAAIVGMGAAAEIARKKQGERRKTETNLRNHFIHRVLTEVPGAHLNGDPEKRLPGNCSFCFDGASSEVLLIRLGEAGICASAGSACSAGAATPSHVLTAIGRTNQEAMSAVRFTLSWRNSREELDTVIETIKGLI